MKLLICPKGHVAVGVKGKVIHIDAATNERRGYALVCDDVAECLLENEGYEIVDPASYPRDINVLYNKVRKTLRQESLDDLLSNTSKSVTSKKSFDTDIPTPVFMPVVWTNAIESNYPATITYSDATGNPLSFVFTKDFTIRSCGWCKFKYWLQNKFRRNKSK